ncbi:MAG: hypothetical protein J6Y58_04240 [Clostridiales bacterium]|nr:hypothetical protein [Clostridiales bacterium]
MKGKDLFDVINDIDDKYVSEAGEEAGAVTSPDTAKVPAAKPFLRIVKRYILPGAVAAAALGLIAFGIWSSGVLGNKTVSLDTTTRPTNATEVPTSSTPPESTTLPSRPTDDTTAMPPTESTEATTLPDHTEYPSTGPTDFHGDCTISVSVPQDKMVEKDGVLVPSVLELTITNEGESPLYVEEVFTLQKQGDDGEWEDGAVFRHETMPFKDRCVAAGETSVITVGILPEHYDLWSGPARLVINVHFYEPDPDDWTKILYDTAFYMKAADFYL